MKKEAQDIHVDRKKEVEDEIAIEKHKTLNIYNHNQNNSVKIRSIEFGRTGVKGKIDYSTCSQQELKSNQSCTVDISVDFETSNNVIPILVKYDIVTGENKDNLEGTGTTVAIIKRELP